MAVFDFLRKKEATPVDPRYKKPDIERLPPQTSLEKMQTALGNRKATDLFLETLAKRNPQIVDRYKELDQTGKRFKGVADIHWKERQHGERNLKLTNGGANKAAILSETKKNQDAESANNTSQYFYKQLDYDNQDREQTIRGKKAIYKETYMPLIGAGLGIQNMPLSVRTNISDQSQRVGDRTKGTMNEMLDGQNLEEALTRNPSHVKKIDPGQLQQLMLMDMLFENQDAHSRQYMVNHNGELSKIDNEEYMGEAMFDDTFQATAKAGSFLAGLPQAHDLLTPETIEMVKGWGVHDLKEMLGAAIFHTRVKDKDGKKGPKELHHLFDESEQLRILENLHDLKSLVQEAEHSGLSARQIYDLYNARDESGKMTGQSITRPANASPVEFQNRYGTRLKPQVSFQREHLSQLEKKMASTIQDMEESKSKELSEQQSASQVDMSAVGSNLLEHRNLVEKSRSYHRAREVRRGMSPSLLSEHSKPVLDTLTAPMEQERIAKYRAHREERRRKQVE